MRVSAIACAAVLAIATTAAAPAQTAPAKWADTISSEIDKAYLSGDAAKMQAARALAERVAMAYPDDGLILHYEAFAIYREAAPAMARGEDASSSLLRAQKILETSLKTKPLAESHALLSSIDGMLIGKDPSRGMELGMAAQGALTAALNLGPDNPRVWLIRGISAIYTPTEYGGGLDIAKQHLEHAVDLFAKDVPKPGEPSWGKAEAYVWLGQVYEKLNDKAKAAAAYKSALDIAPGFAWARALSAAVK